MGFFDIFDLRPKVPRVNSILPDVAKKEIICGRLPILNTNKIFLKSGECCHFIDKAIYEKRIVNKRLLRRGNSFSVPGFFKGTRISSYVGRSDMTDNISYETICGILFITNKRIVFVGKTDQFEKRCSDLIALTPYSNCIELRFSKQTYRLFVPDGNIINTTMHLIKQLEA